MISPGPDAEFDVVVIGGGPAGATVATVLARRGYRCLILESARFPRYHIGESLIPHTYDTFDRLGLLPKLQTSAFPVKHSVRFVSPSGETADPFYFSETIAGPRARTWQVERAEFDRICLDHARENNVTVRSATRCERVLFDEHEQAVGVVAQAADGLSEEIKARVVVDASGRRTVIGTQLGLRTHVEGLDKGSIWAYYRGGRRRPGIDAGETTVFMIRDRGWFWYIPLPDDIVSVGIVASPEYLFRDGQDYNAIYAREVADCHPLTAMLIDATRLDPVRGIATLAYRNRRVAGHGWVMIGDAAAFLDPIYSSGLYLALASAEFAADAIVAALQAGDVGPEKLGAFAPRLWAGIEVIRRLIHAFYDPQFSFRDFVTRHPDQRAALIDCLVGDVVDKNMDSFLASLASMSPPPPALS
jgi:flavin-dependent dehydrogenase